MTKAIIVILFGGLLVGCAANPAVITDLEEDKVIVQSGLGTQDDDVLNKARKGCLIHNRTPVRISHQCLDQYCLRKNHLFACK